MKGIVPQRTFRFTPLGLAFRFFRFSNNTQKHPSPFFLSPEAHLFSETVRYTVK